MTVPRPTSGDSTVMLVASTTPNRSKSLLIANPLLLRMYPASTTPEPDKVAPVSTKAP